MNQDLVPTRLKRVRKNAGMGLRQMARALEMPPSSYGHYEDPGRFKDPYLPMEIAIRIADILEKKGVAFFGHVRNLRLSVCPQYANNDPRDTPPAATFHAGTGEIAMHRSAAVLAVLTLGACAPRPDSIAPVVLPSQAYAGYDCGAAQIELASARSGLAALSAAQNNAATGDAVAVFLVGLPLASAAGGDKSGLIAVTKGEVIALEARIREC